MLASLAAKQQRLRQAQYEAAAEVAVYRAAREESYRKLVSGVRCGCAAAVPCASLARQACARYAHAMCAVRQPRHARALYAQASAHASAQHTGDAGATSKQLEEEGGKAIAAQNASVKKSGDAVVGFLVAAVTKC